MTENGRKRAAVDHLLRCPCAVLPVFHSQHGNSEVNVKHVRDTILA